MRIILDFLLIKGQQELFHHIRQSFESQLPVLFDHLNLKFFVTSPFPMLQYETSFIFLNDHVPAQICKPVVDIHSWKYQRLL